MKLTAEQAARELGISARQVRRAAASGRIEAARHGSAHAVSAKHVRMASRTSHHGRDWSDTTCSAALDLLSSRLTSEVEGSTRSRLKGRIRQMEAGALAGQILRGRAELRRATSDDIKRQFTPRLVLELGLSSSGGTGVLVAENIGVAARSARLGRDDEGDIVAIEGIARHREVLEALALIAYGDTRESEAASRWIHVKQVSV